MKTKDERHDLRLLLRVWDEMAEAALEATDDEIAEAIQEEERDPEEVARQFRLLVERALQEETRPKTPTPRARWASLRLDFCLADLRIQELRQAAVWQPLLAAFIVLPVLIAGVVALVLSAAGLSSSTVFFSLMTGALVAFTGTLVCSASVSVVAAGLGGIPVSVALGILSGLLLEARGGVDRAGELLAGAHPVISGLGGLAALARPSGISMALVASSIVLLGLAMGHVRSAAGQTSERWSATGVLRAIGIGTVGAIGPGLVFGLSSLAKHSRAAELAFALGLAVIGGLAFGSAAGIRSASARRGVLFGLCYAVSTLLLISLGFQLESAFWRLLLATTANHILLQGVFFAWTYVVAEKVGGPRSGVIASVAEGVPPYCLFILSRTW